MVDIRLGSASLDYYYWVTTVAETSPFYGYLEKFTKVKFENTLDCFKQLRSIYVTVSKPKYRLVAGVIDLTANGFTHIASAQSIQLVQLLNLKDMFIDASKDLNKFDCLDRFREILDCVPENVNKSYTFTDVEYPCTYIADIRMVQKLTERLITVERDYLSDAISCCLNIARSSTGKVVNTEVNSLLEQAGLNSDDHLGSLLGREKTESLTKIEPMLKTTARKRLKSPAAYAATKEEASKVYASSAIYAALIEEGRFEELRTTQTVKYCDFAASIAR